MKVNKTNSAGVAPRKSTKETKTEGTTVEGHSISWKSMDKAAFKIGKFFGFKKMAQNAYLRHTAKELSQLGHTDISKLDLKMPESLKDRKIIAFNYETLKEMLKDPNNKDIREKINSFKDLTHDDIKAFLEKTLVEKGHEAVTSQSKNTPLTTSKVLTSEPSSRPSSLWNEAMSEKLKSDTPLGRQLKPITTELNDRISKLQSSTSDDKKVQAELKSLEEFQALLSNNNLLAQVLESNPILKKDFYSHEPSKIIDNRQEYIVGANQLKSHMGIISSFTKSPESKSELSSEKKFASMMIAVHNKFIDSYNNSKESNLKNAEALLQKAVDNKAPQTTLTMLERDLIRIKSQKINYKLTLKDVDNFADQIIKFANQQNNKEILNNINSLIERTKKENISESELIGLASEFEKILTTLNSISINNTKYVNENIVDLFKNDKKYSNDIIKRISHFTTSTELFEIGLVNKVLGPEDNEKIKEAYKKFIDRVFP